MKLVIFNFLEVSHLNNLLEAIAITKEKINNQIIDRIKISDAANHKEALEVAEEWCEENNCILVSKPKISLYFRCIMLDGPGMPKTAFL